MFIISKNGVPLDKKLYSWDETTRVFKCLADGGDWGKNPLVLDFSTYSNCIFKLGHNVTIITGDDCTFETGSLCNFITGSNCEFITGDNCSFKTRSNCKFKTGHNCIFNTWDHCEFTTGLWCDISTRYSSFVQAGASSTITRRDMGSISCEAFLAPAQKIKINEYGVVGFKVLDK